MGSNYDDLGLGVSLARPILSSILATPFLIIQSFSEFLNSVVILTSFPLDKLNSQFSLASLRLFPFIILIKILGPQSFQTCIFTEPLVYSRDG